MLGHATRSPNQSTHEAQRHRLQSNGSSQRLHSSFGSSQGLYAFGSSHGLAAVATAAAAKPNRQGSNGSSDDSSAAAANGVDQSDLLHQFAEVGSPGQPYHAALMSEFGSLPPKHANSSEQLNRILQTHAPYMSKLESLASSATRWVGGRAGGRVAGRPLPLQWCGCIHCPANNTVQPCGCGWLDWQQQQPQRVSACRCSPLCMQHALGMRAPHPAAAQIVLPLVFLRRRPFSSAAGLRRRLLQGSSL
jgi:hypothetical protein